MTIYCSMLYFEVDDDDVHLGSASQSPDGLVAQTGLVQLAAGFRRLTMCIGLSHIPTSPPQAKLQESGGLARNATPFPNDLTRDGMKEGVVRDAYPWSV